MRERNLIDPVSDREIARIIHYLDPDCQPTNTQVSQHPAFESLLMALLLLGGVIACFVAFLFHVAE